MICFSRESLVDISSQKVFLDYQNYSFILTGIMEWVITRVVPFLNRVWIFVYYINNYGFGITEIDMRNVKDTFPFSYIGIRIAYYG